jgi:hypothetical protein
MVWKKDGEMAGSISFHIYNLIIHYRFSIIIIIIIFIIITIVITCIIKRRWTLLFYTYLMMLDVHFIRSFVCYFFLLLQSRNDSWWISHRQQKQYNTVFRCLFFLFRRKIFEIDDLFELHWKFIGLDPNQRIWFWNRLDFEQKQQKIDVWVDILNFGRWSQKCHHHNQVGTKTQKSFGSSKKEVSIPKWSLEINTVTIKNTVIFFGRNLFEMGESAQLRSALKNFGRISPNLGHCSAEEFADLGKFRPNRKKFARNFWHFGREK